MTTSKSLKHLKIRTLKSYRLCVCKKRFLKVLGMCVFLVCVVRCLKHSHMKPNCELKRCFVDLDDHPVNTCTILARASSYCFLCLEFFNTNPYSSTLTILDFLMNLPQGVSNCFSVAILRIQQRLLECKQASFEFL